MITNTNIFCKTCFKKNTVRNFNSRNNISYIIISNPEAAVNVSNNCFVYQINTPFYIFIKTKHIKKIFLQGLFQ